MLVDPEHRDEIKEYESALYLSPTASAMHLTPKVCMFRCQPAIVRLPCHLCGEQRVAFKSVAAARAIHAQGAPDTMLTHWFKFNNGDYGDADPVKAANNRALAAELTYLEFPTYFAYNQERVRHTIPQLQHRFLKC